MLYEGHGSLLLAALASLRLDKQFPTLRNFLLHSTDAKNHVSPLRRSASMRYSARNAESDYLSIARKGGHHQG